VTEIEQTWHFWCWSGTLNGNLSQTDEALNRRWSHPEADARTTTKSKGS
jgi:hypothetical protein